MTGNTSNICGKEVYAFQSKQELLKLINKRHQILVAINAEKLNNNNIILTQIINQNIGYPDGIGAVWALKRKGLKSIKIAGAEFWLDIIVEFLETKTFYFIGSTQEVIEKTITKLKQEFPNIKIQGYRNGFFNEEDKEVLIRDFKRLKPDIIFVAQGSPRQELLMNYFLKQYPSLYMGLGGSFDVYCGNKKRAPKIFIDLGLEWFYRLIKEPTRIKRQLNLLKFGIKVLKNDI